MNPITENQKRIPPKQERAKQRWREFSVVLAGCLMLGSMSCSSGNQEVEPVVNVQVAAVEKTTIEHTVHTTAVLFPRQQSAIVPKISAPVEKFLVNRGSKVREGQLLAVLENRDLSAAAEDTKGSYDQAQATYDAFTAANLPEEIQKAEADLQQAQKSLDAEEQIYTSRQQLYKEGALPRKDLDQTVVDITAARNQYAIAKTHLDKLNAIGRQQELKAAAGQLESAKGKYMGAEAQLSYSEIRSPISGVVTDRPLYPGEMATVGIPLITVMDTEVLIAKAHIPQSEAALLKVGDKGTIVTPELKEPVAGKVTVVSPALDPNSTTVEVWLEAKNPKNELKPGTTVDLTFTAQVIKDALAVPTVSVLTAADGSTTVMLAGSDGRAHQQAVKAGVRQGDLTQILEGVTDGQKVITVGAYGLVDNTKINIESPAPGGESKPEAGEKSKMQSPVTNSQGRKLA